MPDDIAFVSLAGKDLSLLKLKITSLKIMFKFLSFILISALLLVSGRSNVQDQRRSQRLRPYLRNKLQILCIVKNHTL